MSKRIVQSAFVAILAAATPIHAQVASEPLAAQAPQADLVRVALETEKGTILLELDRGKAPITTNNFLAYVDKGWMNGQPFYRAFEYGEGGIIQGGVRDGARQLPPIKHEPTTRTGIKNGAWSIAMANAGEGTTRSDFFIMTTAIEAFDAKEGAIGFAAFGRVVEGQDVVKAILAAPRSPTKGEGVMKGQMLEPVVKIIRARRLDD